MKNPNTANNIEVKTSLFEHVTIRQDRSIIHLNYRDAQMLIDALSALIKQPAGQTEEITSTL